MCIAFVFQLLSVYAQCSLGLYDFCHEIMVVEVNVNKTMTGIRWKIIIRAQTSLVIYNCLK